MGLNPEQKALTLAYTHCELLKRNLNVVIHELGVRGKKNDTLKKRLEKLRQSAYDAFLEVNQIIKDNNQVAAMQESLDNTLDQTWSV